MTMSAKALASLAGAGVIAGVIAGAAGTYLIVAERAPSSASTGDAAPLEYFRVGQVELGIGIEPTTPRVGRNELVIELRDEAGNPVTGVPVDAYAEMPEMGAMPAMRAPAEVTEVAPGRYEGSMELSMRGAWPLTVQLQDPETGGEARLRFDLATDRAGLDIEAGGTPVDTTPGAGEADEPVDASAPTTDESNAITVDNRRRQLIGLETDEAAYRELVRPIRAVGEVAYDERLLSEIALKFDGYIGDLEADYIGAPIEAGRTLFTVYSPELLAAQQEYLEALGRRGAAGGENPMLRAARQRLRLWDVPDAEIDALERRGAPADYVPIRAPRTGTLIARNISDGSAAARGETLLAIADLSRVWVEAEIFEADLDLVHEGTAAVVTLPYLPGRRFEAAVEYVYPYVERDSRTGRLRLTLDNPEGELKPDMYASVSLQVNLGERLSVPEEAVIVAGDTRVVFVDLGDGRLNPVRVETGRRAQGFVEVRDGLTAGDRVVTSGNFLISSETRLTTGIDQW